MIGAGGQLSGGRSNAQPDPTVAKRGIIPHALHLRCFGAEVFCNESRPPGWLHSSIWTPHVPDPARYRAHRPSRAARARRCASRAHAEPAQRLLRHRRADEGGRYRRRRAARASDRRHRPGRAAPA